MIRLRPLRPFVDPSAGPPPIDIESDHPFVLIEVASDPALFDPALASRRSPSNYYSTGEANLLRVEGGRLRYTPAVAAWAAVGRYPQTPVLYFRAAGYDAPATPRGGPETTPPLALPFAFARTRTLPAPAGISGRLRWLRTDGNRLVDEAGDPVVLRGIVRGGLESTERGSIDPAGRAQADQRAAAGITQANIREIVQTWRANVIRLPINQEWALTRRAYVTDLDQIVAWAAAEGAYTILALARLDPRREFGRDASGQPTFKPPLPEENTLRLWRLLAQRYRGHPAVLYDVFDEPHVPLANDTDFLFRRPAGGDGDPAWTWMWMDWVQRIEAVVHRENPRALLFVSGLRSGLDVGALFPYVLLGRTLANTVYSAHVFPSDPNLGVDINADLQRFLGLPGFPSAAPVFVGAWGGGSGDLRFGRDVETFLRGRHRYRNGVWQGVVGWTAQSWLDEPFLVEHRDRSATRAGRTVTWRSYQVDSRGRAVPTDFGELVLGALQTMPLAPTVDYDPARARPRTRYTITASAAVRGDFFLVRGHDFTPGTTVVFRAGGRRYEVRPRATLPWLLVVPMLPATVPLGAGTCEVRRPDGVVSERLPVNVAATPATLPAVTVLMPGAAKAHPYTIAIVANPAVVTTAGATAADPILAARPRFHQTVADVLTALFALRESVLAPYAPDVRVVARWDPVAPPAPLARQILGGMTEPIQANIVAYAVAAALMPDVCFAVYRAPAFNRPSAFRTNDAAAAAGDPAFTYDGGAGRHPSGTSQPGVVAMSSPPVGIITPLHEFLHAATSDVNGACWDLYADTVPVVREINRKRRASAAARLPVVFARYNGRDYESDLPARGYRGRGGIGYPAGWLSYGAALIDRSEPNVMDNYYLGPDLRLSRLDALTLRFVRDRIESKLAR